MIAVDLLHPVPFPRVDLSATKTSVQLAFASGVSGGLFDEVLGRSELAASSFEPSSFAADLFLSTFVNQCFRVHVAREEPVLSTAYLVRLLSRPPRDPKIVEYRRAILRELSTTPTLRRELERLYVLLRRYRTLLEGAGGVGWDANRRQLDILESVKEIFDCLEEGFGTARSGLETLAAFGRRVRASEPFASLADLLRYDEDLATLDVKVRVGADGKIRGFRVLSIAHNEKNPFVTSAFRRFLAQAELFLRGFRFGHGEVMARLIDAVFDGVVDDVLCLIPLLGDVEFYLGALGFRDAAEKAGLGVCLPELVPAESPRRLEGVFNPLLLSLGAKVVPCDLSLDRHATTTLVTGPNSGGKTRLLQAIGLAQLLAQAGVFIPARSGTVSLATGLVVSLIQETRADQAEGRLGMELLRIRELFERLPASAMVILDELCSGTNPSEGEEIFELVVDMLTRLAPQAFITTHFLAFAARLAEERKIQDLRFLQVELDPNQEPTYQFSPGVAKTSLAGHAAARLGVTGDQLLALVEARLASTKPHEN